MKRLMILCETFKIIYIICIVVALYSLYKICISDGYISIFYFYVSMINLIVYVIIFLIHKLLFNLFLNKFIEDTIKKYE